jgi:hypothetical protein
VVLHICGLNESLESFGEVCIIWAYGFLVMMMSLYKSVGSAYGFL